MKQLELQVQGEEETASTSVRDSFAYSLPLTEEIKKPDTYSDGTKFALQRLRTYGCEAKIE